MRKIKLDGEKTRLVFAAVARTLALKNHLKNPEGTFDKKGRFYLHRSCPYCAEIRPPSTGYPYTKLIHGRSFKHNYHQFPLSKILTESEFKMLANRAEQYTPNPGSNCIAAYKYGLLCALQSHPLKGIRILFQAEAALTQEEFLEAGHPVGLDQPFDKSQGGAGRQISSTTVQPIEWNALQCIRRREFGTLRYFLLEGVDPNAMGDQFLQHAAKSGSAPVIRLLFSQGAIFPRDLAAQMLRLTVSAASPDALTEVLQHLDDAALQAAIRQDNHSVIIIAGDVIRKAMKYLKADLQLSESTILKRRDEFLGGAARFGYFNLGEPLDDLWTGVVKRSNECAQILRRKFHPVSQGDHRALNLWLAKHTG